MLSKSTIQRRNKIVFAYANNPDMARAYVKMNNWTYIEVQRSLFGNGFCATLMCTDYIGGSDEFFPLKREAMAYAREASRILGIPVIQNGRIA